MRKTVLGRFGRKEDIANAAVYLASDLGAYVTGLDLTRPLEPEQVRLLRAAIIDHLVVFLPDQAVEILRAVFAGKNH